MKTKPLGRPDILALDFDGVVCDGLLEYFQTAWKAYGELFPPATAPPPGLAERFYPLRPVIESGWEMPMVLRALLTGVTDDDILQSWPSLVPQVMAAAGLEASTVARAVDGVRDRWIHQDLDGWLAQHRFYPGVLDRIQQGMDQGVSPIIISTKEGRFIQQLLSQRGLNLPAERILGKEIKQPKYETLRQLKTTATDQPPMIWFVEDRIKALQAVKQQPDLGDVELFLADWGYNTAPDRATATQDTRLHSLSLGQFTTSFDNWVLPQG